MIRLSCITGVFTVALLAPGAGAQERSGAQWVLEGTVGRSAGRGGGVRNDRDGAALDALIMSRPRSRRLVHAVLDAGGGLEGPGDPKTCLALPGSGCVPDFPRIYSFGLFVGAEHSGRFGDVRLLAGPTHYRVDGGGSSLGGQARFEIATPSVFNHVALVASARGGLVSNLDRQKFRLGAVGIGLAVH